MQRQTDRQKRGAAGEQLAAEYLRKRGVQEIRRNYRCRYGEIDLIAQDGQTLVFVEVRYRGSVRYGRPEETIGIQKQRRITAAAALYLAQHGHSQSARFDVVAITDTPGQRTIDWIRDAFSASHGF